MQVHNSLEARGRFSCFQRVYRDNVSSGNNSGKNNVVLITGASSGIGKYLASFLFQRGYKVYGTSRKQYPENMKSQSNGTSNSVPGDNISNGRYNADSPDCGFIKMIQLDVCQKLSYRLHQSKQLS